MEEDWEGNRIDVCFFCYDMVSFHLIGEKIMIAFVRGIVSEITESSVTIDTGNIGYEIYMTSTDLAKSVFLEEEVKVHTYLHVREDAMQLYGFLLQDDLRMFKQLLGVNGIGPKAALGILSGLTADQLRFAILSEDIKTLSKAPGIGKKTAQKLILELKDRLNLQDAFEHKLGQLMQGKEETEDTSMQEGRKEAVEALEALGYSSADALRAVSQVTDVDSKDVEEILRAALKNF